MSSSLSSDILSEVSHDAMCGDIFCLIILVAVDVKTERWKMRSANVIATLPRLTFCAHKLSLNGDTTTGGKEDEEETCPVCMDCFEGPQEVAVLPCQHFFHVECCEGWLKVISTILLFIN